MNNFIQQMLNEEFTKFLQEEFVAVMCERGHHVEIIGDEIMMEQV